MEALEWIIETLATLSECIISIYFITTYLDSKYEGKSKISTMCLAILFLFTIIFFKDAFMVREGYFALIYPALYTLYAVICLKGNLIGKISISFFAFILNLVTIITIPYLVSKLTGVEIYDMIEHFNALRIITLMLTKVVYFYALLIVLKLHLHKRLTYNTNQSIFVVLFQLITLIVLVFILNGTNYTPSNQINQMLLIIACGGVILSNVMTYLLINRINYVNQVETDLLLLQQQHDYQKQYINDVKELHQEVNHVRHDLKNHMYAISILLQQKQYDQAMDYLEQFTKDKINNKYNYVRSGNDVADAIINTKIAICKEKDIEIVCHISSSMEGVSPVDLGTILTNLFDNAIEACEKQKDRKIFLVISEKKGYISILMKNSIDRSVLRDNPKLFTSKKEKQGHGIGTKSITKTVKKYNGLIEFYEQEHAFICDILLRTQES